jgi:hypothetical protein
LTFSIRVQCIDLIGQGPKGIKVSDEEMASLNIKGDAIPPE